MRSLDLCCYGDQDGILSASELDDVLRAVRDETCATSGNRASIGSRDWPTLCGEMFDMAGARYMDELSLDSIDVDGFLVPPGDRLPKCIAMWSCGAASPTSVLTRAIEIMCHETDSDDDAVDFGPGREVAIDSIDSEAFLSDPAPAIASASARVSSYGLPVNGLLDDASELEGLLLAVQMGSSIRWDDSAIASPAAERLGKEGGFVYEDDVLEKGAPNEQHAGQEWELLWAGADEWAEWPPLVL